VTVPVETVLFGSLLAVDSVDIARAAVVAVVVVAALALLGPRVSAATFDGAWARPAGARNALVDTALLALTAACVVAALPVLGSLLVSGLLVVPAATARLLSRSTRGMLAWSVVLAMGALVGGLLLARELDAPPGGAAATLAGAGFALAYARDAFASRRGVRTTVTAEAPA
jgi:ABC-type Mn2+/Zn2+ transport system permease subunit